jgi:hypothetical protein
VLWSPGSPTILNPGPDFGVQSNQLGFLFSWATNLSVVVETCTNLAHPVWSPVATNALTNGQSNFSDAKWMNYHSRFYRLGAP